MATTLSRREPTTRAKSLKRAATSMNQPSDEAIRVLAYDVYERRCERGAGGDAVSDWIEAERRLAGGLSESS